VSEIKIRFTSQQLKLLQAILDEEVRGTNMSEVVLTIFREFVKQQLGREAI
jgi:hypothetical protein